MLDWRMPRARLGASPEPQTYANTGSGGGAPTPVTPYRPQPAIYMPSPQFPWYIETVKPPSAAPAVAREPEVFIRRVPGVQVRTRPVDEALWADLRRRVAVIPWRGSKPQQGATAVSVVDTLKRRAEGGDPDAEPAARGFVARMEREDLQWQASRQAELQRYYDVGKEYRASQEAKALTAAQGRYPGAIVTRTMEEYRAAVAANPGRKVVKLPEDSFTGKLAVSLATSFAPKIASSGASSISSGASQQTERLGVAIKDNVADAASAISALGDVFWGGGKKAHSSALSWEDQARNLIAPIAGQYVGQAAVMGFGSYFDKYISGTVPADPAKARGWANKVYLSLIGFAMHATKAKDPAEKAISTEITSRWESRLRQDIAEAARTDTPASQEHVEAARRVQDDLRQMRADIENTTARVVQAKIQAQPATPIVASVPVSVAAPTKIVVQRPVAKPPRRYGPESYDLPE